MNTTLKKQISEALKEAMNREDLHTRETAKYLNLNPCYVSMAQNEKSWDSMGKTPWIRLEEWFRIRGPISEFLIPAGEEIWKPKEKVVKEANPEDKIHSPIISKAIIKAAGIALKRTIKEPTNKGIPVEAINPLNGQQFIDIPRLKFSLDIEISLFINGQKIQL